MSLGIRELSARAAIQDTIARYCRAIDRRDFSLLRNVYHKDAIDEHAGMFSGTVDEFIPFVTEAIKAFERTTHMLGQTLISISDEEAFSEAYFKASHVIKNNADGQSLVVVSGRYVDRHEMRNGEWRIAHRVTIIDWTAPPVPMSEQANAGQGLETLEVAGGDADLLPKRTPFFA
ncbi:nuclear transport factor 2 family protein [Marinicaulis aureus]|uniref:Nuclear transport factor 2 family protein n=1 Tax=Hyphococcus aureus TaxID=2666033 RepID=A0ABW1KUK3_9PROT